MSTSEQITINPDQLSAFDPTAEIAKQEIASKFAELHETAGLEATHLTHAGQEAVFSLTSQVTEYTSNLQAHGPQAPMAVIRTGDLASKDPSKVDNWVVIQSYKPATNSFDTVIAKAGTTSEEFANPIAQVTSEPVVLGKHPSYGNFEGTGTPVASAEVSFDDHGNMVVKSRSDQEVEIVTRQGSSVTPQAETVVLGGLRQANGKAGGKENPFKPGYTSVLTATSADMEAIVTTQAPTKPAVTRVL
jgi:hypothetical protein